MYILSGFLFFICIFLAVIFYIKYSIDNVKDNGDLKFYLDIEIKKIVKKNNRCGLIVGVYKDEKTYIKSYGNVNDNNLSAPTDKTIFQIASVSKLFTAGLLVILSEEGVVNMEVTLDEVIGDIVKLSSFSKSVTLKQLATHTSGFPNIPKSIIYKIKNSKQEKELMKDPYGHIEWNDITDYLEVAKRKKKPGKFLYSNFGMGLLGHVLEKITKKTLSDLALEKLFSPLKMKNTGITLTSDDTKMSLSQGYGKDGKPYPVWTFKSLEGAGAFYSTMEDMMAYLKVNIGDATNISSIFNKMHMKQCNEKSGLGWMQPSLLDCFLGNENIVWHNGLIGGYSSYIGVDKKFKTGIVILSSQPFDLTVCGTILMRVLKTQSWANYSI